MNAKSCCRLAVWVVALVVVLGALPAWADVTVSTSDGLSLALTNVGAISSITVGGQAVPLLTGVPGGFFIVSMDGVALDYQRHTYYAGTQITGTATQSGADVHFTGAGPEPDLRYPGLGRTAVPQGGRSGHRERHGPRLSGRLPPAR